MSNQVKRSIAKLVKVSDRVIRQEHSLEKDYFLSWKQINDLITEIEKVLGVKAEGNKFDTVIDIENAFYKSTRSIEHEVVKIISEVTKIKAEYISRDSNVANDFGTDLVDAFCITGLIEEKFEIDITDEEHHLYIKNVGNVQKIIDLVKSKIEDE